jgi:sec-independent protein translocase protein TatA
VFGIGPEELIVILVIALIVFGPKRLPEIGRTLGRSLQEFRKASNEIREHLQVDLDEKPANDSTAHSTPPVEIAPTPQSVDPSTGSDQGSAVAPSQTEPGTNGPTAAT